MKTIYKYEVQVDDLVCIELPKGAQIISAAENVHDRYGSLFFWAIVDTEAPLEERRLAIRGTGHPLGEVGAFIATCRNDPFIWHVFEAA